VSAAPTRTVDWSSPRRIRSTAPAAQRPPVTMRHPAWLCVAAALGLSLAGFVSIAVTAGFGAEGAGTHALKHLIFIPVGLLAAAIAAAPHYRLIGRMTPLLAAAALGMLVFVLLPVAPEWLVTPRNGARRWISLGVVDFQPSELAKIAYVLALAWYLRFRKNYRRLFGLIPPLVITFVPVGLIVLEPDLGTALLFLPTLFAMLIAAGAKLKHLALVVIAAGLLAPTMYPLLQPHQRDRIHAMWNQIRGDRRYADSINYQGYQSMTLVGAGGVTGLGPTKSRAVIDFNDLPEDHNDMIYAVVVNRFGLLGGGGILGLYLLWMAGALWSAALCKNPFGRLVIVGLAAMLVTQAMVNIGMTVGLLPITGMTLPFVSYGGSSLVAAFLSTGLVFNIAMRRPAYLERRSFEFGPDED